MSKLTSKEQRENQEQPMDVGGKNYYKSAQHRFRAIITGWDVQDQVPTARKGTAVLRLDGEMSKELQTEDIFASMHRAADARDAAARNVIVKLARPFSGEEDLFKQMVSFL